jgi:hypothetical protein
MAGPDQVGAFGMTAKRVSTAEEARLKTGPYGRRRLGPKSPTRDRGVRLGGGALAKENADPPLRSG